MKVVTQPQAGTESSGILGVEVVFLVLYWLATLMILIYINLITLKLNSSNRYTKKMIYLLIFLVNYILGKAAFKHINPILSTGLPLLSIYLTNRILGDVIIIGLTGGIACGKSTLVKGLKDNLELKIIDCDEISRSVSLPGHGGYNYIMKILGDQKSQYIDVSSGMIKRDKLADLTFRDNTFRKKLTQGVGKYIFWELLRQLLLGILSAEKYILIDAPLLFETKVLTYLCYPIIVVYLNEDQQITRLIQRNNYSREEAISRIKSQMPLQEKIRRANIAINNNKSKQELVQGAQLTLEKFLVRQKNQ